MNHRKDTHDARYILHNQLTNEQMAPKLRDAMLGIETNQKLTPVQIITLSPTISVNTATSEAAASKDSQPAAPFHSSQLVSQHSNFVPAIIYF